MVPLWRRQIEIVRSKGWVELVVSADPVVIQWVLDQNMTGLLFSHPVHVGPTRRPQQGNRSWEELVVELGARP